MQCFRLPYRCSNNMARNSWGVVLRRWLSLLFLIWRLAIDRMLDTHLYGMSQSAYHGMLNNM